MSSSDPLVPEQPDPNLILSLQDGVVSITSTTNIMSSRPDWSLLARWWVNGKPFVPQRGHAPNFGGENVLHFDKRLLFQLNMDAAKIGARSGDEVAVQMMLCDAWCYFENPDHMSRNGNARLTNKASFIVQ